METHTDIGALDVTKFLEDFTKEIVADPGHRQEIISGWAKTLNAREEALRAQGVLLGNLPRSISFREVENGMLYLDIKPSMTDESWLIRYEQASGRQPSADYAVRGRTLGIAVAQMQSRLVELGYLKRMEKGERS